MSFDQPSPADKPGVDGDSFSIQPVLRPMSRRHIMSLGVRIAAIVGLASTSLFVTAAVYTAVQDNSLASEATEE